MGGWSANRAGLNWSNDDAKAMETSRRDPCLTLERCAEVVARHARVRSSGAKPPQRSDCESGCEPNRGLLASQGMRAAKDRQTVHAASPPTAWRRNRRHIWCTIREETARRPWVQQRFPRDRTKRCRRARGPGRAAKDFTTAARDYLQSMTDYGCSTERAKRLELSTSSLGS